MLTFSVPNFSQLFGLSGQLQNVPHRCPPLSRSGPLNFSAGKLLTERLGYARRSVKLTATALKTSYTESCKNLMRAIQPVQDLLQKFWATDFVLSWHNHYADVRMALDKITRKKYAMKTVSKDNPAHADVLYEEAECWNLLQSSEGAAELEGVYQDERTMYFVYELCRGGDLQHLLETHGMLSEVEAAQVVHTLLSLISDCHKQQICFGPPHPDRLGLAQMYPSWAHQQGLSPHPGTLEVKAVDFSVCCRAPEALLGGGAARGSAWYMAPEMLTQQFGPEADVWGVGVLMYQLLSGELPFCATLTHSHQPHTQPCREAILSAITNNQLHFNSPAWAAVSPEAQDLICAMLQRNPSSRITPQAALDHPWLASLRSMAAHSSLNLLELTSGADAAGCSMEDLAEDPLDSMDDLAVCEILEIGQPGALHRGLGLGLGGDLGAGLGGLGGLGGGELAGMSLMYRSRLATQLPDLNGLVQQLLSPATLALVVVVSGCCVLIW